MSACSVYSGDTTHQVARRAACLRSVVTDAWSEMLVIFAVLFCLFLYILRPSATPKDRRRHKAATRAQEKQQRSSVARHTLCEACGCRSCPSTSCRAHLTTSSPIAVQSARSPHTPAASCKAKLIGSAKSLNDSDGSPHMSSPKRSIRQVTWSSTSFLRDQPSQPHNRSATSIKIAHTSKTLRAGGRESKAGGKESQARVKDSQASGKSSILVVKRESSKW